MNHTPGLWRIETLSDTRKFSLPNGLIHQVLATVNGYPSTVCIVEEHREIPDFDANRLADARLIAAAPELLTALQSVIGWVPGRSAWHTDAPEKAVEQARAAIAKATGEAS